jgi:hypothetical protein
MVSHIVSMPQYAPDEPIVEQQCCSSTRVGFTEKASDGTQNFDLLMASGCSIREEPDPRVWSAILL